MNPFQIMPEMGVGIFVFYNKATKEYFKETNISNGDYAMFLNSPVIDFIGFFKSLIQAQDTIDACIELEKNKKINSFNVPNRLGSNLMKTTSYPLKSYDYSPMSDDDFELDLEDSEIHFIDLEDIDDLPNLLGQIMDSINHKNKKPPKKSIKKPIIKKSKKQINLGEDKDDNQ